MIRGSTMSDSAADDSLQMVQIMLFGFIVVIIGAIMIQFLGIITVIQFAALAFVIWRLYVIEKKIDAKQ